MAMFLDAFVSQFLEKLGSLAKEEVTMILSVRDEIGKLRKKVQVIENVLHDAEKRRIEEKNIDLWLRDLTDVLYDADDVIDEYLFQCKKQNKQLLEGLQQPLSTLASLVCCYPPLTSCSYSLASRHKIGKKIKNINAKLEEISKEKDQFNLRFDNNMNGSELRLVSYETSPLSHNEIVGLQIKEDAKRIIDLLVQKNEAEGCLALGIVGMGGIGKTTLAQEIFNDEIINRHFPLPLRMWVYVSKNFDELKILKAIIRLAGGGCHHPEGVTKTELHHELCKVIENKRFLLVLDDVWGGNVWNALRAPLNNKCAIGSRVLVTARDEGVMREMGAMHLHSVRRLSVEDGWSVLYRKLLLNKVDMTKVEGFKEIGIQIVEKCNGHPLAIQAVVGVLLSISDASEMKWKEVLEKLGNQTWSLRKFQEKGSIEEDKVLNILYLSYQDLPSHLKPCFLSLSLFPEGFKLRKLYVCGRWISEGLIRVEEDLSPEEVAEGYYKEIIRRNMLQPVPRAYDDYKCSMHDLFLSLAKSVVKEENYIGNFQNFGVDTVVSSKAGLRRLSIVDEAALVVPESIKRCKCLRTLMLLDTPSIRDVPEDLFTKLGCLRVLDLSGTSIISLPRSVRNLIHLRFLDISSTSIREIPEVISRLINLQFFILRRCKNLHSLPRCITNLRNLRLLDFYGSPVDYLPENFGELQNLRTLYNFVVVSPHEQPSGDRCCRRGGRGRPGLGGSNLGELKNLREITDLTVAKLEKVSSVDEARGAALWEKQHLVYLRLEWTAGSLQSGGEDDEEEMEKIGGVIDELRPPPSMEHLMLLGFFGPRPPRWLDSYCGTLLPNLRRLDLLGCAGMRQLPPLGRLPQLDYLTIKGVSAIVTIGPELMSSGNDGINFPKLRKLYIDKMPNWEEWWGVEDGSLPCLEVLVIKRCPKLRSIPDGLIRVKEASIVDCPRLGKFSNLPAMESLELALGLEEDTLPEWLQHNQLGGLQKLKIWCSFDLLKKLLPKEIRGEEGEGSEWPKLPHFPHVYVEDREVGSNYYFSYTKCPLSFSSNIPK